MSITSHQFAILTNMFFSEYTGMHVNVDETATREELLGHSFFHYDFGAFGYPVEIPKASRGGVLAQAEKAGLLYVTEEFRPDGPDSGGWEMYLERKGVQAYLDECDRRGLDPCDEKAVTAAQA